VELAIAHIGEYDPQLQKTLTAQIEKITATFGTRSRDDISVVVSRVVDYLQHSHDDLSQLEETALLGSPIQEQALDDNLLSNEMQAFLRMAQLIDQADPTNPMAAAEVAALREAMGQLLDLPAWQLKRLRLAVCYTGWVLVVTAVHAQTKPSCPLMPECSIASDATARRDRPNPHSPNRVVERHCHASVSV
jgi:hypothetical protein